MAAMKLLLSQARRQGFTKPFASPFQQIPRLFSSSSPSDSNPNPASNESLKKPVTIEPVSYAAKPKGQKSESINGESVENIQSLDSTNQEARSSWTREEIRYVKDTPSINPVSYAQRVAPLPEDRVAGEEEGERTPEEMERERKRIELQNRARRRFLKANVRTGSSTTS